MAKWLSSPRKHVAFFFASLTIEFLSDALSAKLCSYSLPTIIGQHSPDLFEIGSFVICFVVEGLLYGVIE